jgi:hypothetical protein
MACHARHHREADQVRPHVEKNPRAFFGLPRLILEKYPPAADFQPSITAKPSGCGEEDGAPESDGAVATVARGTRRIWTARPPPRRDDAGGVRRRCRESKG